MERPFWIYQVGNMHPHVTYIHKLHVGIMLIVLAIFAKMMFERPSLYNLLPVPYV